LQNYQNLKILQNLYRLKAIGYNFADLPEINKFNKLQNIISTDLDSLHKQISTCYLCDFSKSRRQSMSGFGNPNASLMIIDYIVSDLDDMQNSYFNGQTGDMLKKMITNVLELNINDIFLTHCIKCKPLTSKKNFETEAISCKSYLFSQIEFIKPKVIVTLGSKALENLLPDSKDFENLRGHIIQYKESKLIPIYHPSYLIRNPNLKKTAKKDLLTIKSCL
jgi:DNA polymerase